jgi:hypothetical protein
MKFIILFFIFLVGCIGGSYDNDSFDAKKSMESGMVFSHKFDGSIMLPEQSSMRLLIVDPDKNWNDEDSILWQWNVKRGLGIPANLKRKYKRSFTNLSDIKRVMHDGEIYIIFCGSHGDGVAMLHMASKRLVWWTDAGGSPHAIASLPDGNMAVADARGYLKIYSTLKFNNKASQSIRHAGMHGVVWDGHNELLWAWGGSRMESYHYNFDRNRPKVSSVTRHRLPYSWGKGGGHDLAPMIGEQKLLFGWRLGIGAFDLIHKRFIQVNNLVGNAKGLSHNPLTNEIIYTRPDSKDSRTYRVRSLTGPDRAMKGGKWYKARWFIHNKFSYPEMAGIYSL